MEIKIKIVTQAHRIAQNSLRSCVKAEGIVAGPHHFVDLWARDSLFATFGLLKKSDLPVFRTTIETFLKFQRADGLVPYRVMRSKSTIGKYFGKHTLKKVLSANYYSHMSLGLVPDGGLMAIIASNTYVARSKDKKWLQSVYPSLVRTIEWYMKKFGNDLISEWYQCEWADGVLKSGHTLYTNVLYLKALEDMTMLSGILHDSESAKRYSSHLVKIKKVFHDAFWNGSYLSDWIDWSRHDHIATHANFLAIIFGFATKTEAVSILSYAKKYCMNTFTLHNTYPAYPIWRIPIYQIVAGVPEYHNRGILWLQPGITYAMALHVVGQKKEAKAFLSRIAAHIIKHDGVHEVYESKDGTPLKRIFYRSEGPFAWSAGLFLWAASVIR